MVASPAAFTKEWAGRVNRLLLGKSEAQIALRLRWPVLWLIALLILSLILPDRVWTALLSGLGGLVAVAFFWARSLARGLTATRRLNYGWVSVGDSLEEEFVLSNQSGVPVLWVEIKDESNVPGYQVDAARAVGAFDRVRWRQSAVCRRRGQYRLGPWELHSSDPFGIFRVCRRYEETQELVIHPPITTALPIPLPAGRREGRSRTRERIPLATTNAASVRDYQHNDPYRWIHWRTSARRDALYVRQFERDASGDIWVVMDCRASVQVGDGDAGTEEHAVLLAAALTTRALSEMREIGLAAYGINPQIVPPGLGEGQQWRMLRALALLESDGDIGLERVLRQVGETARPGSAAIIITPSDEDAWLAELGHLARLGIECHIVLLDRLSFGGQGNSAGLCRAIHLLGYPCELIRQGEVGHPVTEQDRQGYWEFRVLGTGKAVAVRRPGLSRGNS